MQEGRAVIIGLDMYLSAQKYVSGWPHRGEEANGEWNELVAKYGMQDVVTDRSPHGHVEFCVAYWRKANAIHGWFVQNVQDGEDECRPHPVSVEQLKQLRQKCQDILLVRARNGDDAAALIGMQELPPCSGFFFGVTDIGPWYWEDLENTVDQIDRIFEFMPDNGYWSFVYQSSW